MFPYENLYVYKKAFQINQKIYRLIGTHNHIVGYVRDQLGRASFSVQLNIAEGSGKFSKKDRRNFFITYRSAAFECASVIDFLAAENEITAEEKDSLKPSLEELSRILYAMINNLN